MEILLQAFSAMYHYYKFSDNFVQGHVAGNKTDNVQRLATGWEFESQ
jgi:hypothetical protein